MGREIPLCTPFDFRVSILQTYLFHEKVIQYIYIYI